MTEITFRSASTPLGNPSAGASSGPPPPAAAGATGSLREQAENAYADALARLPFPATNLNHILAPRSTAQDRLDGFMNGAEGPYSAEGQTVRAPAQFRMRGGYNEPSARLPDEPPADRAARQARATERDDIAAKAGLASANALARIGRGSPDDVRKITQALIDANKLLYGLPETLPQRIHDLQWRYGVGLDCAGYVYGALLAVHGGPAARLGLASVDMENFTGLPHNPRFRGVTPDRALAGDVIVLRGGGGEPGHNLIVYSHELLDPVDARRIAATWALAGPLLACKGPIHVIEVDSSFGAGRLGNPSGGVRRDTMEGHIA
jgi:hypothetical protein